MAICIRNFSRASMLLLKNKTTLRLISTTPMQRLKQIHETESDNTTVIEGVYVESPRTPYLLPQAKSEECCTLCKLNLDLQHTDVLILSQFVNKKGKVYPKNVTGLCGNQQKLVETLVKQSFQAGLMPELNPNKYLNKYKRFNRYFTGNKLYLKLKDYL